MKVTVGRIYYIGEDPCIPCIGGELHSKYFEYTGDSFISEGGHVYRLRTVEDKQGNYVMTASFYCYVEFTVDESNLKDIKEKIQQMYLNLDKN